MSTTPLSSVKKRYVLLSAKATPQSPPPWPVRTRRTAVGVPFRVSTTTKDAAVPVGQSIDWVLTESVRVIRATKTCGAAAYCSWSDMRRQEQAKAGSWSSSRPSSIKYLIPRERLTTPLTFAFCRAVLSAERRRIGVGQQRAVRWQPVHYDLSLGRLRAP